MKKLRKKRKWKAKMGRKGTDRQNFRDFYPRREIIEYVIEQVARGSSVSEIKITLMKQKDFDSLWRSDGVNGHNGGFYAYFENPEQRWGYSLKNGKMGLTYCLKDCEKDREVAGRLDSMSKQSALMLDAGARGD